jgi:SAM-dependent methyltransferase
MKRNRENVDYHRRKLNRLLEFRDEQSRKYLDEQLSATYWKKDRDGSERYRYLIDQLANCIDISKSKILCVGSRNIGEISYFRERGAHDVVGIDLFSEDKEILVMDMHDMRFPDDSFNVVLSSHSLEHSLDPQKVASEFIRVVRNSGIIAIEVPVNYQTTNIDLWDFKTVENLKSYFMPYIKEIYLEEYELVSEDKEYTPVDVVKLLFSVKKNP